MKEFPNKEDAIHWLDVMTALSNKKLLKGQIDLLKTAAANRKATLKRRMRKSFKPNKCSFQRTIQLS